MFKTFIPECMRGSGDECDSFGKIIVLFPMSNCPIRRSGTNVECPTLIVHATQPLIEDVIMLPDEVVKRMLGEISNSTQVDIDTTHVGNILHPNIERDQAILNFLALN